MGREPIKLTKLEAVRGEKHPCSLSPFPSLLTLSSPEGTLAAWTPAEAAARDPSTHPHPIPWKLQ